MILTVREKGGAPAGQSCPSRITELSIISMMSVSFLVFILKDLCCKNIKNSLQHKQNCALLQ